MCWQDVVSSRLQRRPRLRPQGTPQEEEEEEEEEEAQVQVAALHHIRRRDAFPVVPVRRRSRDRLHSAADFERRGRCKCDLQ